MERVLLTHSSGSRAEVYAHGAHVASWRTPDGVERLFLSRAARFGDGAAIRGGIPVIFPQFADRGAYVRHGFARTRRWRAVDRGAADDAAAVFTLEDSPETLAVWPFAFRAELRVVLGAWGLTVTLGVENRDEAPISFTAALHSYLRVAQLARARVGGLAGCRYESGVEGVRDAVEQGSELRVEGEVDRVYFDVGRPLELRDGARSDVVGIRGVGFPDVVLWNPGPEKALALSDLARGEEREFLCVEAAAVGRPISLAAGERWSGRQELSVT